MNQYEILYYTPSIYCPLLYSFYIIRDVGDIPNTSDDIELQSDQDGVYFGIGIFSQGVLSLLSCCAQSISLLSLYIGSDVLIIESFPLILALRDLFVEGPDTIFELGLILLEGLEMYDERLLFVSSLQSGFLEYCAFYFDQWWCS
ncbi:MAG: hypothetical protein EZS28_008189 [Streblomastix strix]|uniref:Uncharacterized protein n=1 Tax=Streblomastix strix TaxID=222440 RepID=A0A5J4WN14_9EUKA|nr:MAG: hypothetical protein EZS28_008189 [Streblomastix strix]